MGIHRRNNSCLVSAYRPPEALIWGGLFAGGFSNRKTKGFPGVGMALTLRVRQFYYRPTASAIFKVVMPSACGLGHFAPRGAHLLPWCVSRRQKPALLAWGFGGRPQQPKALALAAAGSPNSIWLVQPYADERGPGRGGPRDNMRGVTT